MTAQLTVELSAHWSVDLPEPCRLNFLRCSIRLKNLGALYAAFHLFKYSQDQPEVASAMQTIGDYLIWHDDLTRAVHTRQYLGGGEHRFVLHVPEDDPHLDIPLHVPTSGGKLLEVTNLGILMLLFSIAIQPDVEEYETADIIKRHILQHYNP